MNAPQLDLLERQRSHLLDTDNTLGLLMDAINADLYRHSHLRYVSFRSKECCGFGLEGCNIFFTLFGGFPNYIATERYRDNVAISFIYRTISRQILFEWNNFKDVHNVKVFLYIIYHIFTYYFLFIIYLNFISTCNCHCILYYYLFIFFNY